MAIQQIYSKTSNPIGYSATTVWNMLRDAMQVPNWHPFMWHNPAYDYPTPNSIGVDHIVDWPTGTIFLGIYKVYEIEDNVSTMYIRYNVIVEVSNSDAVGDWDNYVDFTVIPIDANSCRVLLQRNVDLDQVAPHIREATVERTVWLADQILPFIEGVEWDSSIEQLRNPNKSIEPPPHL